MSRRLLAFLLSELKTVRVICPRKECGAVTEVTVEQLGLRFDREPACPVCKHGFPVAGLAAGSPFSRLADAVRDLSVGGAAAVEFVLPDPA